MIEDQSNREFRKIPSLDFLYEVNDNGTIIRNVKSKRRTKIVTDKHHAGLQQGYAACFVCLHNKVRRVMLAKVVAECWLGKRPEGLQIDHIDRNSLNNDYRNLRYVTQSEQMKNRVLSNRVIMNAKNNIMKHIDAMRKPVKVDGIYFKSKHDASVYLSRLTSKNAEALRDRMKRQRKEILGHTVEYLNAETGHSNHIQNGKEQSTLLCI